MYKTTLPQEAIDYIVNKYEKEGEIDKKNTAKEIISLFGTEGTLDAVRHRVAYLVKQIESNSGEVKSEMQEAIEALNDEIEEKQPKYEIVLMNNKSYWKLWTEKPDSQTGEIKKVEHLIPIEDDGSGLCLLNICFDYSRSGGDMTQIEVQNKYQLKPEVRQQIKSTTKLYKSSPPIPERVAKSIEEQNDKDYINQVIEDMADKSIDKYGRKQREAVDRKFKKKAEEAIATLTNWTSYLDKFSDYLKVYKPREVKIEARETNSDHISVVFGDLHVGEDTEATKQNFYKMVEKIISLPEDNIDMFCLGDLVETLVVGGMHLGQVEGMDETDHMKLVMGVVEMLENMLVEIAKAGKNVNLFSTVGNHDRSSKHHIVGDNGMWGLMIYELVKRGLQNISVNINYYQDKLNTIDINGTHYIFHHGDDGFSKKAKTKDGPFKIAYKHGKIGQRNVILFAHDHHFYAKNPSKDLHVMGVPSVSGQNRFAKAIDESSNPGFGVISEDGMSVHYL